MAQLTPICVPCARSMRCTQNEFAVRDKRTDAFVATVWSGDRFTCPDCNASVVVGFGRGVPEDRAEWSLERAKHALEFRR
jgi:hypothetical protein